MDQGVAAAWAGIAGLAGAGIGGGFAAWGSWLGGRKAVEAAERAEQRAATAEHQHWQREKRYDAYQAFLAAIRGIARWQDPDVGTVQAAADELHDLLEAVAVMGPREVVIVAENAMGPVLQTLMEAYLLPDGRMLAHVQPDTPAQWTEHRGYEMRIRYDAFQAVVGDVLGAPPE